MKTWTTGAVCALSLTVALAVPARSEDKLGVVTTVVGPVTVARTAAPSEPLKFKDDIFRHDRVTTGDNAITRILLGGKVVVTARERSTLTITEVPGLSTIDLSSGRIAVAVDKTRMKPGERVDVRTPNAIAGVRGTVLIVEAERNTSTVTVLRGLVEVVRLDPKTGRAVGPVTPVGAQQAVSVRNNVLPPKAQSIPPARAQALSAEFTPPMRSVDASAVMPVKDEVARAATLIDALVPPAANAKTDRTTGTSTGSVAGTVPTTAGAPLDAAKPTLNTAAPTLGGAPTLSAAPTLSTPTLPTTTLAAPIASVMPTVAPPTTLAPPPVVPATTSLIQPIVQPVVQNVVQPVLAPVTKLLK
jgi:FecR protein